MRRSLAGRRRRIRRRLALLDQPVRTPNTNTYQISHDLGGGLRFAFTRSTSSSLVALPLGSRDRFIVRSSQLQSKTGSITKTNGPYVIQPAPQLRFCPGGWIYIFNHQIAALIQYNAED